MSRRGGVRAAQQQAGPFLWDSALARQEVPPEQPEHAAARLRPPQHRGLLRPGYFCRYACVCVLRTPEPEAACHLSLLCSSAPGPDTKLMQNSGRTKFKRTSIDRLMNTLVLWVGHLKLLTFSHYFGTSPQPYHILVSVSAAVQL